MASSSITLWIKSEPFTIGALPIPPHPRLTASNIRKIVPYAKSKGSTGYPQLSYSVWKHIACNKLQIPEGLANAYFITFDQLNQDSTVLEERDQRLSTVSYTHDLEAVLRGQSVPTLRFVLYLYIQHIHKISLRASLVSGSDEWPSRKRANDQETRASKGLYENAHLTFLLSNLKEILDILSEPGDAADTAFSGADDIKSVTVGLDAVYALDFLIAGSTDGCKSILMLHEVATLPVLQQKTGYLQAAENFSLRNFQAWLRSHLTSNPFGIMACATNGQRVDWPLLDEDGQKVERNIRGRITSNAYMTDRGDAKGNRVIVLSKVSRETIARCTSNLEDSTIKIHRCHYSYIYLLSPVRSVIIEGCINSTIVVGAVELSLDLVNCESTTVMSVCRRFTAVGCKSCTVHLLTPDRPLLFNGNNGLVFAPFNTYYGKLEDHMHISGLNKSPNVWNLPLYLGNDSSDEKSVWELMHPDMFHLFTIPFDIKGSTKTVPGMLSSEYQRSLDAKLQRIQNWQKIMHKTKISREQREAFQEIVERRFQEWLLSSGLKAEVDSLATCGTSKSLNP